MSVCYQGPPRISSEQTKFSNLNENNYGVHLEVTAYDRDLSFMKNLRHAGMDIKSIITKLSVQKVTSIFTFILN